MELWRNTTSSPRHAERLAIETEAAAVNGPVTSAQREVFDRLHASYNMKQHTKSGSEQAAVLSAEFIDDYAAVGPVDACVAKLRHLADLGIDKVVVSGPSAGSAREQAAHSQQLKSEQVIPQLKMAVAS